MQDAHLALLSMRFALVILLALLPACGKIGDPKPPFIRIPEAVTDLSVVQSGHNLVLTWTNPPRYIDGSAATNLARVQIRTNGAPTATVNVSAAGQPQSFLLPVGPGTSGERSFTVVVETTQGKLSETSNVKSVTPVEVPGGVRLTAIPDQRRIFLRWDRPQDHPELADAYIVTRTDAPAEAETVTDTRYEDARYQEGKTFTYQVTPARRVSGALVMGVASEPYTVTVEDKTPPKNPSGLEIALSDTGAILTWDPNAETDLAGYRVFRSERADSGFMAVSDRPVTPNMFFDVSYRPGLYYAVSAVDEFGNESAKSTPFHAP